MATTVSAVRDEKASHSTRERIANVLSIAILSIAVITYAIRNLGNRYFWSDEASSLYTSLGWPEIGDGPQSIGEAWAATQSHIEPGLFNMLEYVWAVGIGTHITAIRFLPFLFLLAYLVAIVLLSRFVNAPLYLGAAVVGLMLLENITPYYAVELRPHIAGLAAAVVLPLLTVWLMRSPGIPRLAVFILGFLFFGSMQYTSYPIQFAIAGVLLLAAARTAIGSHKRLLIGASGFAVMWLPVTFVLVRGNPFRLAGGTEIHAIPEAFFPNLPVQEVASIVATNLLSPTGLPRTVFILLLPVLWIAHRMSAKQQPGKSPLWTIQSLWIIVTTSTAISFILAMLGFMPWILGTRWTIADVGLIALSLVGIVGLIVHSGVLNKGAIQLTAIALALVLTLVGSARWATYDRTPGYDWTPVLEVGLQNSSTPLVIDNWTYPEVRYWVELSGAYDQYEQAWLAQEILIAGPTDKATVEDVSNFLSSNSNVMILRNDSVLPPADQLADVEVRPLPLSKGTEPAPSGGPVLLIRAP